MKVYRLHNQLNLWEGPFTQKGMGEYSIRWLRDHRGPSQFRAGMPTVWANRIDRCFYAWSTIAQMWMFVEKAERWEFFFEWMYVSELEVKDYHQLPDGQVMFMSKGASVIKRYTTTSALRAAFEET